jgi:hypothetical protein
VREASTSKRAAFDWLLINRVFVQVLEVAHPLFLKGRADLLEGVVRNTSKSSKAKKKASRGSSASTSTESTAVSPVPTISIVSADALGLPSTSLSPGHGDCSPLSEDAPSPEPVRGTADPAAELEQANLTIAALQDRLREAGRKNGERDVAIERLKGFLISRVPKDASQYDLPRLDSSKSRADVHALSALCLSHGTTV